MTLATAETQAQTFERAADATMQTVRVTYTQRGAEYADTWALENQVATFTRATLRDLFGIKDADPEKVRLLLAAALVDVKDSRLIGPFKADSIVDGVAYRAMYCKLREEYEASKK